MPVPKSERDLTRAEFARRLAKHMDDKSWNQSDMARAAERYLPKGESFRRDSISTYLNQLAVPRPKHLNAIAKALGVTPEDLLPGVSTAEKLPYSMRPVSDEPGMAYLTVDMKISTNTALAVLGLINQSK